MSKLHVYDENRLNGEISDLHDAYNLLIGTYIHSDKLEPILDVIKAEIAEGKDALKYGFDDEGAIDYPKN